MTMQRTKKGVAAALLLAALSACGQPELPTDHYYRLQVPPPKAAAQPALKGTIEVNRFSADGLVAGRAIVYTESGQPHQLKEYHYHFWTEPPALMLRDQLVAFLRGGNLAQTVTTPEMRANADHVLTGRIIRLEKIEGARPQGVLDVELAVRSARGQMTLLNVYSAAIAADNNSVEAGVLAINKALEQVYTRFAADLARK
ncbi:MAG: ABC transporter [Alphaproteobacteria bacterium]|nr:ABC transporter [Alphaproteobacteria bacterium]